MGDEVGFAGLLQRKYDIMQQQADTAKLGMQASANLDTVRAGLLPKESVANIGLTAAQTALAGANTRQTDVQTQLAPGLASANIYNTRAQGRLYGSQAAGEDQATKIMPDLFKFRGLGENLGSIGDAMRQTLRLGMGPFASE